MPLERAPDARTPGPFEGGTPGPLERGTPGPVTTAARPRPLPDLPPRRYWKQGLAAYVALLATLVALGQVEHEPASTAREDRAAEDVRARLMLVRLGRETRRLECLTTFDFHRPDLLCQRVVLELSTTYPLLLTPALSSFPSADRAVGLAVDAAHELAAELAVAGPLVAHAPGPPPGGAERWVELGNRAKVIAIRLDNLLELDSPGWDEAALRELPLRSAPPRARQRSSLAPAPEGVATGGSDAASPGVEEEVAALPSVAGSADSRFASDDARAVEAITVKVGEPVAAAAREGAAPSPTLTAEGGSNPTALAQVLAEALWALEGAGHEPAQISHAVMQVRAMLGQVDGLLATYRGALRDSTHQEKANAFARQADKARGRLLRAANELLAAARVAVVRPEEAADNPFASADRLLEQAGREVQSVLEAAPQAP